MDKATVPSKIETAFRNQVKKGRKVKNAYLLVHSEKLGIHLNIAEGKTDGVDAYPRQPNHLASVGKLFTAALIGILHEKGELSFDDRISKHLDDELMDGLHVYKGKDYSDEIRISHLLNQSSGLDDVFFRLWERMVKNPFNITPRGAVFWGKENLKPKSKPGEKHHYGDTNYYLLGLIIERVTKKPFHEAMHEHIFNPLGMTHACIQGYSEPAERTEYPTAKLFIHEVDALTVKGISRIDYAGGGVVAPLEQYLIFMKALVGGKILRKETLARMLSDDLPMGFPTPGFNYGYAIWKFKTIPVFMPEKYNCWGCVGVTGAFMFYHPKTESHIIGTFNDFSYRAKALRFMVSKVIKQLLMCE
ncbi:MAG: serine hydrolase [Candidatus Aminicenantales bacterium]